MVQTINQRVAAKIVGDFVVFMIRARLNHWWKFEHAHVKAYARMRDADHLPAWTDFNRRIGLNGDFGIWHEALLLGQGKKPRRWRECLSIIV